MVDAEDLLTPAHCVSHTLQRTARRVSGIYSEELRACGLGRTQFPLLENLAVADVGISTTDLARRLDVDRTTLTRILIPLEKAGLVARRSDSRDARVRMVTITPAGLSKLEEGRAAWRRAQARTLALIGTDTWRDLETDLRQLRRVLS
ncbi:MAG: MarR family winged helix-turn-helix transcriptional regulator [Phenylobacterium sp.]